MVQIKRVYDPAESSDGFRVLVDRLWPRGVSKVRAKVDLWLRDIAPSNELRKWFGHDPAKWKQFQSRYKKELKGAKEALDTLRKKTARGRVTLLFGARDVEHNEARVLMALLNRRK